MKHILTVNESASSNDKTLIFNIGAAPEEPDIISEDGFIRTEVPGDGPAIFIFGKAAEGGLKQSAGLAVLIHPPQGFGRRM